MDNKINFWWDFELEHKWNGLVRDFVIVESNDPHFPLIAVFESKDKKDARPEIKKAEELIVKLENGELDYKVLGGSFVYKFVKSIFPNFVGFR